MRSPRFQDYRSADGWRWRLLAGNGRIIAVGEAHTRRSDARRAIAAVLRVGCSDAARFQAYRANDGWRWRLRARNGRIVAVGEAHTRCRDALRAITTVRRALAACRAPQQSKG